MGDGAVFVSRRYRDGVGGNLATADVRDRGSRVNRLDVGGELGVADQVVQKGLVEIVPRSQARDALHQKGWQIFL